jgi:hypothetical protein
MKKILFIFLVCFGFITSHAQSAIINIEGQYQGKNVFIVNPFRESGIGFCVDSIWVNGRLTAFENASAFEIQLNKLSLGIGDSVSVRIKHFNNCEPGIINQAISPKTFEISNVSITRDKVIKWTCLDQDRPVCFNVEQYRWNKWLKVVDTCINGKNHSIDLSSYDFHAGENKFRISSKTAYVRKDVSGPVLYNEIVEKVTFFWDKGKSEVQFNHYTGWELFNEDGAMIKIGTSYEIDCAKLKAGTYFLNYDNLNGSFKVKRKK